MTRLEEIIWDIRACLEGLTIQSKLYGEGLITQITGNNPNDLIVHIHFNADNEKRFHKAFNIAIALKTKNIILPDYTLKLYNGFMELAQEELIKEKELERQKKLEEEKLRKEEEERKEAQKQAKKAAEAFERTKKRMIEKFEERANQIYTFDTYGEQYYYSIGWLASHIKTVTAALPDYLENAFIRHFGADVPRTVVDSSRKSINGFSSQWSYSFTAGLRDADCAPALIQENMNPTSKHINNTSFLWELIDNVGFKFGKTQDVNEIRSHIPKDMIDHFELGYNT